MHSTALLGWLGAALSIALPWPQVWRSVARGRTRGLSATACWQGTAMPVGWITYGLLTGETVQVVTNTVTGLAGLTVLAMVLVKHRELRSGRRLMISAAGAAVVLSAAGGSAAAAVMTGLGSDRAAAFLGAVLACTAILGAIPQPLSLLRDRGQDLAGLSPLRWWLAAAACGSWCTYGLLTGQSAVWLSAAVGLTSALIVCWVLVTDRRTRLAAPPAPAVAAIAVVPATAVIPAGTALAATVIIPATAGGNAGRPGRAAVRVVRPVSGAVPATAAAHREAATAAHRQAAYRTRPAVVGVSRPAGTRRAVGRAAVDARSDAAHRPARGIARVPRTKELSGGPVARTRGPLAAETAALVSAPA